MCSNDELVGDIDDVDDVLANAMSWTNFGSTCAFLDVNKKAIRSMSFASFGVNRRYFCQC